MAIISSILYIRKPRCIVIKYLTCDHIARKWKNRFAKGKLILPCSFQCVKYLLVQTSLRGNGRTI